MGTSRLKGIGSRIFTDYISSGRWADYRAFLSAAKDAGYQFICHRDTVSALGGRDERLFFLRHDIDTDASIAGRMFAIEQDLGVSSSYYFRLCTADIPLMREIADSGCEVGYHYEEIADYAKEHGLKTREAVLKSMDAIRMRFLGNFRALESEVGRKILTIAAHGDWINRKLGIPNQELVDENIRQATGIVLEAYDAVLNGRFDFRTSDANPDFWGSASPAEGISLSRRAILVLVHPRQWQRSPGARFCLDLQRCFEEVQFRFR